MLSLAWPWMLLVLPLPFIARALLPEAQGLQEAGLRVPSIAGFAMLTDRSRSEQLLNWRFWVAMIAWVLLVLAVARWPSPGPSELATNSTFPFRGET
jgi:Ca-activated chloride channel family protein